MLTSRLRVKNEKKRQKEFFERQKYAGRMKFNDSRGAKGSQPKTSLDLVSLEMANLTAEQFQNKGSAKPKPKPLAQASMGKPSSYRPNLPRRHHVELPGGSPPTPSMLQLEGDTVSSTLDVPNKFGNVFSDGKSLQQPPHTVHHGARKPTSQSTTSAVNSSQPVSAPRLPTVARGQRAAIATQPPQDKPVGRRQSSEDLFFQFTTSSTRPTSAAPSLPQVTTAPPTKPAASTPLLSLREDNTSSAEMSVYSASSDDEDDSPVFNKGYDIPQKHVHSVASDQRSLSPHSAHSCEHSMPNMGASSLASQHSRHNAGTSSLASFRNLIRAEWTGGYQGPPQSRMDHGPSSSQLLGPAAHQPGMYHGQSDRHLHQKSHIVQTVNVMEGEQAVAGYGQSVIGDSTPIAGTHYPDMDRSLPGHEEVTQCFTPVSSSGSYNTVDPMSHGHARRRLEYNSLDYRPPVESIPRLEAMSRKSLSQQRGSNSSVDPSDHQSRDYHSPTIYVGPSPSDVRRGGEETRWSAEGSSIDGRGPGRHSWSRVETIDLTCHETANFTSPESISDATHLYQPAQDDQGHGAYQHNRRVGSESENRRTPQTSSDGSVSPSHGGFPSQVLKELLQLDADLNGRSHPLSDNEVPFFKKLKRGSESFIESFHASAKKRCSSPPIQGVPRTPEIQPSKTRVDDVRETNDGIHEEQHNCPEHETSMSPFSRGVQMRALESISLITPKKTNVGCSTPQTPRKSTRSADSAGVINSQVIPADLREGIGSGAGDVGEVEPSYEKSVVGEVVSRSATPESVIVRNVEYGAMSQSRRKVPTVENSAPDGMVPPVASKGIQCQVESVRPPLVDNSTQCNMTVATLQVAVGTQTGTCGGEVQWDEQAPPKLGCDTNGNVMENREEKSQDGNSLIVEERGDEYGDTSAEVNPVEAGATASESCDHVVSSTVTLPTVSDDARASTSPVAPSAQHDHQETLVLPEGSKLGGTCLPSISTGQIGHEQGAKNLDGRSVTSNIVLVESADEGSEHIVDDMVEDDEAGMQQVMVDDKGVGTHRMLPNPKSSVGSVEMSDGVQVPNWECTSKVDDSVGIDERLNGVEMIAGGINEENFKRTEDMGDTDILEDDGSKGDDKLDRVGGSGSKSNMCGISSTSSKMVVEEAHAVEPSCKGLVKVTGEVLGRDLQGIMLDPPRLEDQRRDQATRKLEGVGEPSEVCQGSSQSQDLPFSDSIDFVTQSTQTDTFDSCSSTA